MKKSYLQYLLAGAAFMSLSNCSDNDNASPVNEELNTQVLLDFSANLPQAVYSDLSAKTSTLYDQVVALGANGATDDELAATRATWKQARQAWEQSEAFLFGPVSTKDIDPHIDTWPVNFNDLNAQLTSGNAFTEDYINNLDDALKGFHPIEYLIFGEDGAKKAADLSERDMEYLTALALNLKTLTADANNSWKPSVSGNYHTIFTTAGKGSATYATQLAAYQELVNAMAGICDEVANGKLDEPFTAQDPSLEESPFAQNSIIDFTNNIKGVQDVYLGKYSTDGKGLEDIVRQYNLQLDSDIKAKIDNAINALGKITDPFGKAITTQAMQIETAMSSINDLKDILETELLPFVQQHTK